MGGRHRDQHVASVVQVPGGNQGEGRGFRLNTGQPEGCAARRINDCLHAHGDRSGEFHGGVVIEAPAGTGDNEIFGLVQNGDAVLGPSGARIVIDRNVDHDLAGRTIPDECEIPIVAGIGCQVAGPAIYFRPPIFKYPYLIDLPGGGWDIGRIADLQRGGGRVPMDLILRRVVFPSGKLNRVRGVRRVEGGYGERCAWHDR